MPDNIPVPMQSVISSNLVAVGYDADNKTLYVTFKNGATYAYSGVPEPTYQALLGAESLGSFFHTTIRSEFPYTKM